MNFADRTRGTAAAAQGPRPRVPRRVSRRIALRVGVAAAASGALAAGALALVPSADAMFSSFSSNSSNSSNLTGYSFTTLGNANDPTFNQLLGINDHGMIAGYFGSGAAGHPNQGYLLQRPYSQASYVGENFPGSVQTQVTGLNNHGATVGFFSDQNNQNMMNDNFGFYDAGGRFHKVSFPTNENATPPVDQLLGINDQGVAVGFYTDAGGNNRGYTYNTHTRRFARVLVPGSAAGMGGPSLTAAAINNSGDIAGFYTTAAGGIDGFVKDGRHFTDLAFPGAASTMALGINDGTEAVGTYTVGTGSSAVMHGFTWRPSRGFRTVDDPNGMGATTINGVNNRGDLVGFYTDTTGNTDGFLAAPAAPASPTASATPAGSATPTATASPTGSGTPTATASPTATATPAVLHLDLMPMPAGTASFGQDGMGQLTVQLSTFGLTPGSSHTVELLGPNGSGPLAQFGMLTASAAGQGNVTLDSTYTGSIPGGSRLVILNGSQGDDVSNETIAKTSVLGGDAGGQTFTLKPVEVSPAGASFGTPDGQATIAYDPGAQTLTVTVNASGLTPGNHAAHIHLGSCASQGAVQYMMMDLVANSQGNIVDETRVITGVTAPVPASGWYLNIHQGDSNTILRTASRPSTSGRCSARHLEHALGPHGRPRPASPGRAAGHGSPAGAQTRRMHHPGGG